MSEVVRGDNPDAEVTYDIDSLREMILANRFSPQEQAALRELRERLGMTMLNGSWFTREEHERLEYIRWRDANGYTDDSRV